ncbi:hypothetical protein [Streptomyces sp. NPDC004658]|uniref:hypothetical protein n=1 Tax=Streptomyces sp. NPDC004658 TaxID=3154672 RepID=UPI0033B51A8F
MAETARHRADRLSLAHLEELAAAADDVDRAVRVGQALGGADARADPGGLAGGEGHLADVAVEVAGVDVAGAVGGDAPRVAEPCATVRTAPVAVVTSTTLPSQYVW